MPERARTQCTAPGCTSLAQWRGRCDTHRRDERPSSSRRGYDRYWSAIRSRYARDHPYCESELHRGACVMGSDVDHIIPIVEGGTNEIINLQMLCRSCHTKKTIGQTAGRVKSI